MKRVESNREPYGPVPNRDSSRPVNILPIDAERLRRDKLSELVVTGLCLFTLTVVLQFLSGAFASELAAYPDEPAHYVTGLMVRDYIAAGFPMAPLEYATEYNRHYPKIALGHWPPVFYVIQALWTLLFTPSRVSILLLMAVVTSVLAALLYWRIRAHFGALAGFTASCVFVALPAVQRLTAMVMPEILIALFGFLAAIHFGRFLDKEDWRDCVWFAAYSSLAILTKGNGWALALLPGFALLLKGALHLVARPGLWVSALVVLTATAPWYLLMVKFMKHVWIPSDLNVGASSWVQILYVLVRVAGLVPFALAVVGLAVTCVMPLWKGRQIRGEWAAMGGLFLSVWVFHSVVPLAVESRKLLMVVAPMLMLAFAGGAFVWRRLGWVAPWMRVTAAVVVLFAFVTQTFTIPQKPRQGFIKAAETADLESTSRRATYLVSAGATGEGAFISEVAMRDQRPGHVVIRASKALASMDWNGGHYRSLYKTPQEVQRYLQSSSVSLIVLENLPGREKVEHHSLLKQVMEQYSDQWTPVAIAPNDSLSRSTVKLFRRAGIIQKPSVHDKKH